MGRLARRIRRLGATTALATGALAVAGGTGTAFAWFTSQGSGTGTAAMGSISVTLTTAATPTSRMLPGSAGAMNFTVQNNGGASVQLASVALLGGQQPATGATGCATTDGRPLLSLNPTQIAQDIQTLAGSGQATIAAHQSTPFALAGAVTLDATVTNACQGATFTIPVQVTATRG